MRKILVILPYDRIYPPVNGGMLRCFHILHQLASFFEVSAIINMEEDAFRAAEKEFPLVRKIKIYSTTPVASGKKRLPFLPEPVRNALLYRWWKRTLEGPADSNFLRYYPVLRSLLRQDRFDYILLENIGTIRVVDVIRRYDQQVPIIFDAHNVDTFLARADLEKGVGSEEEYTIIKGFESNLHRLVDLVLTCSTKDYDGFQQLNDGQLNAAVIPNGVWMPATLADEAVRSDNPDHLIFCGSLDYAPNIEGLHWFLSDIWPLLRAELPQLKLIVIGSGGFPDQLNAFREDAAIEFNGRVPEVQPWYSRAAVSIVPLKTGSGTRLKILEAMSLGIPIVSTSKGAEGIEYEDGKSILIADDKAAFASMVADLINNKNKRIELQKGALSLVARYDWNRIGTELNKVIENLPTPGK